MEFDLVTLNEIANDSGLSRDDEAFLSYARQHYYPTGECNQRGEPLYAEMPDLTPACSSANGGDNQS